MHFCASHCLTFTLENGQYTNYSSVGSQRPGQKRVFKVESFTPESVIIRRTDYGDYPSTNLYTGPMGDNGNSLTGNGWKITWGTALNALPQSDEERAARCAGGQQQWCPGAPPPSVHRAQAQQDNQNIGLLMLLLLGAMSGGTATGNDPPGACPGQNCSVVCPSDSNNHTGFCH